MIKRFKFILVSVVALFLIWSACQQVISVVVGIGSVIPPRMVNQEGYVRHLRGTIEVIDKMKPYETKDKTPLEQKLDWLLQRYMEEAEFKLRYVEVCQNILKKLAGAHLVESA